MGGSVKIIILVALAAAQSPAAESARILAVETSGGKSHWNFMSAVLDALLNDGHHVTAFTAFAQSGRQNYTAVDMSGEFPPRVDMDVAQIIGTYGDARNMISFLARVSRSACDMIYRNGRMREILRRGRRGPAADFDVILVQPLWLDCVSFLATELDVPVVYLFSYGLPSFLERPFLGHVANPATVSDVLARHASVPKTMVQRFTNSFMLVYGAIALNYYRLRFWYTDPKHYDRCRPVPPSMLFVNSHFTTEASRPNHPNVIGVGGIHLIEPKPLPSDILQFIEDSPHGVILLTFGSTVNMSTLPEHVQTAFVEAMGKIPQRVLWKYEVQMENKPNNVMIKKWFPQRDILVHPNVKLFISHGGISGLYEAVDAGVPVLGFPLIGDQPRNIANLVDSGMAISMDLFTLSKDPFRENVLELVNNKKYKMNAEIASKLLKDRPMTPAQSVVYWTEYVIRHKEVQHLKSHALNLPWYHYFMLDVIGVSLITCLAILFLICYIFKIFYLLCIEFLKKQKLNSLKSSRIN